MVNDMVLTSARTGAIGMSPEIWDAMMELRTFLFDNVYFSQRAKAEEPKAPAVVQSLFAHYLALPEDLPPDERPDDDSRPGAVGRRLRRGDDRPFRDPRVRAAVRTAQVARLRHRALGRTVGSRREPSFAWGRIFRHRAGCGWRALLPAHATAAIREGGRVGRISDEDVRRVRDATDLVSLVSERVVLKPKGRLHWGCCPFHAEKTASFKVDPATQLWHCFGCGLGGDAYGFLMRAENVDFLDAVRILADRGNIEIVEETGGAPRGHRERLIAANEAAWLYYHEVLTKSPDAGAREAREYLKKRGFGSEVAKRWRLGFAPGHGALVRHLAAAGFSAEEIVSANLGLKGDAGQLRDRFFKRVMFPIFDLQGRAIAFGGRVIGAGEPKYLNTQDTPAFHKSANLYAIDRAKASITSTGTAVVVEGYTDVIALHEAGLTNAVATLGTALTREHVRLLSRFAKRVVYLFDGDAAGLRAADRASEFIDSSITPEAGRDRVELHVAVLPDGPGPGRLRRRARSRRAACDHCRRHAAAAVLHRPPSGAMGPRPAGGAHPGAQGRRRGPGTHQGLAARRRLRDLHRRPAVRGLRDGSSSDRDGEARWRSCGASRTRGRLASRGRGRHPAASSRARTPRPAAQNTRSAAEGTVLAFG